MFMRSGGPKSVHIRPPSASPASDELKQRVSLLPKNFDWRNIDGMSNF